MIKARAEPIKKDFKPFIDYRGLETIGKPLISKNEFNEMKKRKELKNMLSFIKKPETETKKTVLKKVNPLQAIMNKKTAKPETEIKKPIKAINADNVSLSIEKFKKIDDIMIHLNGIHNVIGKQSETINTLSIDMVNFSNRLDAIEKTVSENNALLTELLKGTNTKPQTVSTSKPETAKPQTDTSQGDLNPFQFFMKRFNKSFCGSTEITAENEMVFNSLYEFLNNDVSEENVREFIRLYTVEPDANKPSKYLVARKSTNDFIDAILTTLNHFNGTTVKPDTVKKPSETINREYWKRFFSLPDDSVFIDSCIELIKDSGLTIANKELIESTILTETDDDTLTVSNDDLKRFYNWLYNFIK